MTRRTKKRTPARRPSTRARLATAAGGSGSGSAWPKVLFVVFLGGCIWAGHTYGSLPDVRPLASENPRSTALIDARAKEAAEDGQKARRQQRWVRLSEISPHAVEAVLASEDDRFFEHAGLDLHETKRALADAWEKKRLGRGASTLTQQLAKNLWLSNDRSVWRKAKELILARRLEDALEKRRILELYLNIAEWGDGIYGIDAAARAHFGVPAAELTFGQGAILASMLPAPRTWTPSSGSEKLRARSLRLIDRFERYGRVQKPLAEEARREVNAVFGGERRADAS